MEHQPLSLMDRIEEAILCLLLLILVGLSSLQIGMRLFFDSGFIWIDPLLRYLVIWVGMLGAVLAVSRQKHICLDLVNNLLEEKHLRFIKLVNSLFCFAVCTLLTYASWLFLKEEVQYANSTLLTVPLWAWNTIFPLAFGLMASKYGIGVVRETFLLYHQLTSATRSANGHK